MKIDLQAIFLVVVAAWCIVKRWYNQISRIVEPLIVEAEKMAVDGIIDKDERKNLVMLAIATLEKDKKIKLDFLGRLVISKIVDIVAGKLPDFKVSQSTREALTRAKFPV